MPQSISYLQSKEARIGVHEAWCDPPIASMPVDQNQFSLSHLPDLLYEFRKDTIPHYFGRVISVKINLHKKPF